MEDIAREVMRGEQVRLQIEGSSVAPIRTVICNLKLLEPALSVIPKFETEQEAVVTLHKKKNREGLEESLRSVLEATDVTIMQIEFVAA